MQHNLKLLFTNLLKKPSITKGELFTLTKLAGKDALRIKPLKAFTNNIEMHSHSSQRLNHCLTVSSPLKRDVSLLLDHLELYQTDKISFDDVFSTNKQIEINAYSVSALKQHIGDFDLSYFKMSEDHIQSENGHKSDDEEWNELSSIYVLLKMYCNTFRQKNIQIYSDNIAVINMLNKYSATPSKPHLQSPIIKIASVCMEYQINCYWSRVVGVPPIIVDKKQMKSISDPFQTFAVDLKH